MKAFVFPGQGTQFVGMCREEYSTIPTVKTLLDLACQILKYDIKRVMFEGPADELNRTAISQPAIFLCSCCLLHQISEKPDAVAGHSLGEYTALVAAKAIDFADAIRLVQTRAEAMQRASMDAPGAMAAVIGLEEDTLSHICTEVNNGGGAVWVANLNSPEQTIISGQEGSVGEATSRAQSAGAKRVKKLAVAVASHTPLMQSAAVELEEVLIDAPIQKAVIPIYMNVDGKPHTDPAEIKTALLRQLTHPVRWAESIHNMGKNGINEFIEIGHGNILQGLIRRIVPNAKISGVETHKAP